MSNHTLQHTWRRLALAAALAAPMASFAQAPAPAATPSATAAAKPAVATPLSTADQDIVKAMAMANMTEVELGKLAQSKAQSADVKSFAQQMIDDHGKALTEVQTLAQNKGVTLPAVLDTEHKKMEDKLGKLNGAAFDKAYLAQAGVAAHKKVHAMLEKDAKKAKDEDVKALANKMLPTVEQHLNRAQMEAKSK